MSAEIVGPYGLADQIATLYREGLPPGDKTGWPSLDKHYTVKPGQMSIVTGWPGSGKSEWVDALMVNLSHQGWRFAVFSPENQPHEIHVSKLMEKYSGMPFGSGPTQRMAFDDVMACMELINGRFGFMRSTNGDALSVKSVIEAATPWLEKNAEHKRGLIIDPWNELEHWRPAALSETEYVSQQLSYVRNWARQSNVHVWIVAHPQKMRRDNGELPVPRPDMISGSQHWWNKADCAITVYRAFDADAPPEVEIHVQKVRFKHVGSIGAVKLRYDRVTGRYHELAPNLSDVAGYYNR